MIKEPWPIGASRGSNPLILSLSKDDGGLRVSPSTSLGGRVGEPRMLFLSQSFASGERHHKWKCLVEPQGNPEGTKSPLTGAWGCPPVRHWAGGWGDRRPLKEQSCMRCARHYGRESPHGEVQSGKPPLTG